MGYLTKRMKVRRYNRHIKLLAMVALTGVEINPSTIMHSNVVWLTLPDGGGRVLYAATRHRAALYVAEKFGIAV